MSLVLGPGTPFQGFMMIHTTINGIPCQAEITHYQPYRPMVITGTGFGDAEPPDHEEMEFAIFDRKGSRAKWLEGKMSEQDEKRICDELKADKEDL